MFMGIENLDRCTYMYRRRRFILLGALRRTPHLSNLNTPIALWFFSRNR